MKLNTNSNSYIIVYSAVLVVIVAFLLAFVYQALKPRQDANVELDIKKQILYSLNIRGLDGQEAEAKYADVVKSEEKTGDQLYYACEIDGQKKYVFPLKGMGLWGGISAFVAVDDDPGMAGEVPGKEDLLRRWQPGYRRSEESGESCFRGGLRHGCYADLQWCLRHAP